MQKKIIDMSDSLTIFKKRLEKQHYSSAFIQHLVDTITQNPKINTLQQIYQLVLKESQLIIKHFHETQEDLKLIEYRNPLCFESIRDYFHKMTRGVYKRHGSDIGKFKEGLKNTAKQLIQILASSTNRLVKNTEQILKDNHAKKILIYSYSKAVTLSLKKLSKSLEDNLEVFICRSGALQQGLKLYEQLVLDGVNCHLINDNEISYYISDITCVLVGAQVILDNGAIINRAGTAMIATLAYTARKPLYVLAESYKFLRKTFLCQRDIPQKELEGKFKKIKSITIDLTLPEYITMFCTDTGLYNPQVISLQLSKILK